MIFANREEAGTQLAARLFTYRDAHDAIVLALPRGGVAVGAAVARALHLPLDIIVTRKIGAPGQEEYAIGAIDEKGNRFLDPRAIEMMRVSDEYIEKTIEKEKKEAARRLSAYRGNRAPLDLKNKTVILVDDGIATGATMRAAIVSCKEKGAVSIIVAVPVAPPDAVLALEREADSVIILHTPYTFAAVGQFYQAFEQVMDEEVVAFLDAFLDS